MLVITTKSPYAVRALAELARRGRGAPVPIGEIARARDIPVQFLEGLFATLRRAGHPPEPARGQGRLQLRPLTLGRDRPRDRRAARGRAGRRRRRVGPDLDRGGGGHQGPCWPARRSPSWRSARPRRRARRCTTSNARPSIPLCRAESARCAQKCASKLRSRCTPGSARWPGPCCRASGGGRCSR